MIGISGYIIVDPDTIRIPREQYRYIPYDETKYSYKTVITHKQKRQSIDLDISNLVKLGGVFEKVGEEDESIGGGDQKVGSANK